MLRFVIFFMPAVLMGASFLEDSTSLLNQVRLNSTPTKPFLVKTATGKVLTEKCLINKANTNRVTAKVKQDSPTFQDKDKKHNLVTKLNPLQKPAHASKKILQMNPAISAISMLEDALAPQRRPPAEAIPNATEEEPEAEPEETTAEGATENNTQGPAEQQTPPTNTAAAPEQEAEADTPENTTNDEPEETAEEHEDTTVDAPTENNTQGPAEQQTPPTNTAAAPEQEAEADTPENTTNDEPEEITQQPTEPETQAHTTAEEPELEKISPNTTVSSELTSPLPEPEPEPEPEEEIDPFTKKINDTLALDHTERSRAVRHIFKEAINNEEKRTTIFTALQRKHFEELNADVTYELMNYSLISSILTYLSPLLPNRMPTTDAQLRQKLSPIIRAAGLPEFREFRPNDPDFPIQLNIQAGANTTIRIPTPNMKSLMAVLKNDIFKRKVHGHPLYHYFLYMIQHAHQHIHDPNVPKEQNPLHLFLQQVVEAANACNGRKISVFQTYLKEFFRTKVERLKLSPPPTFGLSAEHESLYYKIQTSLFSWFQDYKVKVFQRHFLDFSLYLLDLLQKQGDDKFGGERGIAEETIRNLDHSRNYYATILETYGIDVEACPEIRDIYWNSGRVHSASYIHSMPYLMMVKEKLSDPHNLLIGLKEAVRMEAQLKDFDLVELYRRQIFIEKPFYEIFNNDEDTTRSKASDFEFYFERKKLLRTAPYKQLESEMNEANTGKVQFLTLMYYTHLFYDTNHFPEFHDKWQNHAKAFIRFFSREFLSEMGMNFVNKVMTGNVDGIDARDIVRFLKTTGKLEQNAEEKNDTLYQYFISEEDFISPDKPKIAAFLETFRVLTPPTQEN